MGGLWSVGDSKHMVFLLTYIHQQYLATQSDEPHIGYLKIEIERQGENQFETRYLIG